MKKKFEKKDIQAEVVTKICEMLDKGTAPWFAQWRSNPGEGSATNPATGTVYKGINRFLIPFYYMDKESLQVMTWKQFTGKKYKLKKGSKSAPVFYFQVKFKDESGKWKGAQFATDAERETCKFCRILKFYRVFNVQDMTTADGEPVPEFLEDTKEVKDVNGPDMIKSAEKRYQKYLIREAIPVTTGAPAYSPGADKIYMPPRKNFKSAPAYYSTLAHEIAHSTGHKKRLNRDMTGDFGSNPYAKEELIAELSACFINRCLGIENTSENNAAYLAGWSKKLRKEPKSLIFTAAAAAERAREYFFSGKVPPAPAKSSK